jgi:hypothetical protein
MHGSWSSFCSVPRRELQLRRDAAECIGRGKARSPYEFGCKVSIATPVTAPKGGQFVLHAKALHGSLYDGHTLGPVIPAGLTGVAVRRIHGDKGYRGHNYPDRFKVWISGLVCLLDGRLRTTNLGGRQKDRIAQSIAGMAASPNTNPAKA